MARQPTSANLSTAVQTELGGTYPDVVIVADNIDAVIDVAKGISEGTFVDVIDNIDIIKGAVAAADAASISADEAAASATAAQVSANNANTSATQATTSADNADISANTASDASEAAQRWANNPEDDPVEVGGEYSALHYSAKSAASAVLSENSANSVTGEAAAAAASAAAALVSETNAAASEAGVAADAASANADAGSAGSSATGSATSAIKSSEWAITPKGTLVPSETDYSSKHYALTASDEADRAEAAADNASASLVYRGVWDASTGVYPPDQTAPSGTDYYLVQVAGTIGGQPWTIGDQMIYNSAGVWDRIEGGGGGGAVDSVNGQTGVVVLDGSDLAFTNTNTGLTATDIDAAVKELAARGETVITHVVTGDFTIPTSSLENFDFTIIQLNEGISGFYSITIPDYDAPSGAVIEIIPTQVLTHFVAVTAAGNAEITAGNIALAAGKESYLRLVTEGVGARDKIWIPQSGRFFGATFSSGSADSTDYVDTYSVGHTSVQGTLDAVINDQVVNAGSVGDIVATDIATKSGNNTFAGTADFSQGLALPRDIDLNFGGASTYHPYMKAHSGAGSFEIGRYLGSTQTAYVTFLGSSGNGIFRGQLFANTNDLIWNAGNDGSGSGLNADLLDGQHASEFAPVAHTHSTSGVIGLDAALASKLDATTYTAADVLAKLLTVDGNNTGLNADTVDGLQAASFLRSDADDTATGLITFAADNGIVLGGSGTNTSAVAGSFKYNPNTDGFEGYTNGGGWGSLGGDGGATPDTPSQILTKLLTVDGSGSNLDADLLDGLNSTINSDADTVAVRDSNGDIAVRSIRSELANSATISGGIGFRVNAGADNYIRYCSDIPTVRTYLDVYSKGEALAIGGTAVDSDMVGGLLPAVFARTSTTITAGNGLSGGGNLGASRTLSVNTDRGLNIVGDNVGVNTPTDSGLLAGTDLKVDIAGTTNTTTTTGSDSLLINTSSGLRNVTRDDLLASVSGGIQLRGSISPASTDPTPITTITTTDTTNTTISQNVAPVGANVIGFTYIVLLSTADKLTGVTVRMGGAGSPSVDFLLYDQDQLIWSVDQWYHLQTGDSVISVHGRTGAVVGVDGDYTGSQITNVPFSNISSNTVQGAINELAGDVSFKANSSQVLTDVPAGAVFTDTQNTLSNSITSTSTGISASSAAAKAAADLAKTAQTTADSKLDASAYTAADILVKLKTVDGNSSGLNADTLDGNQATDFANAAHTHAQSDVTGLVTALAGKEPTFTKNSGFNKAFGNNAGQVSEGNHVHPESDVTGLTTSLAGKSNTNHTHTYNEIINAPVHTVSASAPSGGNDGDVWFQI